MKKKEWRVKYWEKKKRSDGQGGGFSEHLGGERQGRNFWLEKKGGKKKGKKQGLEEEDHQGGESPRGKEGSNKVSRKAEKKSLKKKKELGGQSQIFDPAENGREEERPSLAKKKIRGFIGHVFHT